MKKAGDPISYLVHVRLSPQQLSATLYGYSPQYQPALTELTKQRLRQF
jgi:hypothetical protein